VTTEAIYQEEEMYLQIQQMELENKKWKLTHIPPDGYCLINALWKGQQDNPIASSPGEMFMKLVDALLNPSILEQFGVPIEAQSALKILQDDPTLLKEFSISSGAEAEFMNFIPFAFEKIFPTYQVVVYKLGKNGPKKTEKRSDIGDNQKRICLLNWGTIIPHFDLLEKVK